MKSMSIKKQKKSRTNNFPIVPLNANVQIPIYIKSIALFSLTITLVLASLVISWLIELEKLGCPCAKGWQEGFIKGYLIITIIYNGVQFITVLMDKMPLKIPPIILLLYFGLTLAFLIISIKYVNKLKKEKCECSQDYRREILLYWSWVLVGLYIFTFSVGILLSASTLYLLMKK
jgi:hypothetical protein